MSADPPRRPPDRLPTLGRSKSYQGPPRRKRGREVLEDITWIVNDPSSWRHAPAHTAATAGPTLEEAAATAAAAVAAAAAAEDGVADAHIAMQAGDGEERDGEQDQLPAVLTSRAILPAPPSAAVAPPTQRYIFNANGTVNAARANPGLPQRPPPRSSSMLQYGLPPRLALDPFSSSPSSSSNADSSSSSSPPSSPRLLSSFYGPPPPYAPSHLSLGGGSGSAGTSSGGRGLQGQHRITQAAAAASSVAGGGAGRSLSPSPSIRAPPPLSRRSSASSLGGSGGSSLERSSSFSTTTAASSSSQPMRRVASASATSYRTPLTGALSAPLLGMPSTIGPSGASIVFGRRSSYDGGGVSAAPSSSSHSHSHSRVPGLPSIAQSPERKKTRRGRYELEESSEEEEDSDAEDGSEVDDGDVDAHDVGGDVP